MPVKNKAKSHKQTKTKPSSRITVIWQLQTPPWWSSGAFLSYPLQELLACVHVHRGMIMSFFQKIFLSDSALLPPYVCSPLWTRQWNKILNFTSWSTEYVRSSSIDQIYITNCTLSVSIATIALYFWVSVSRPEKQASG